VNKLDRWPGQKHTTILFSKNNSSASSRPLGQLHAAGLLQLLVHLECQAEDLRLVTRSFGQADLFLLTHSSHQFEGIMVFSVEMVSTLSYRETQVVQQHVLVILQTQAHTINTMVSGAILIQTSANIPDERTC